VKIKRFLKFDLKTGTLHEDLGTFVIISRTIPGGTRSGSDKNYTENQNTHFGFYNFFQKS
jgi:hypothetical protein